jgi:ATP-dependent RNA helicase DDX27
MGVKRSQGFILTIEEDDDVSQSESESEDPAPVPAGKTKKRKIEEESLNPEFEFDGFGVRDVVSMEEEGWDFKGIGGVKESSAIDLEGIIARRRRNLEEEEEAEAEAEEVEEGSEDSDGSQKFHGFDDDELMGNAALCSWLIVAEDGFGMGADDDEADIDDDEEKDEDGEVDKDDEEGFEGPADERSDNESIASLQPHPDDLASSDDEADQNQESDAEERALKEAYFAPAEETPTENAKGFDKMDLSRPILKALSSMNFHNPTQIQSRTIPIALQGKDIVGSAVTGSGKTAAFIIPVLERLNYRSRAVQRTRVLILTPTRELAMQCFSVGSKLAQFTDVKFTLCVGGLSVKAQEVELRKGPDVVIATPGRFIDHVRNSQGFVPDGVEILVIDEADRYLGQP